MQSLLTFVFQDIQYLDLFLASRGLELRRCFLVINSWEKGSINQIFAIRPFPRVFCLRPIHFSPFKGRVNKVFALRRFHTTLGISAHSLPFGFYLARGNLEQRGVLLRSIRGILVPRAGPLLYRVLLWGLRGHVPRRLHVDILDGYVLDDGRSWVVGRLLVVSCPGKCLFLIGKHAFNVWLMSLLSL